MHKNNKFLILIIIIFNLLYGNSEEVITNCNQNDGFGSQFQAIITSAIYAELHNKKFIYTPFTHMDHNYDNDPYFIIKKEKFINFIDNFDNINNITDKNYTIKSVDSNSKIYFDTHVAECAQSTALQKIKKIFRANKNSNYFNNTRQYRHSII